MDVMGRWALLVTMASCSFTPGVAPGQASTDGNMGTGIATFDAAANARANDNSRVSWIHTASGSHRLIVVGVSQTSSGTSISTVSYGGTAMTLIGTRINTTKNIAVSLYDLVAPPTGPQMVSVMFGGNVNVIAGSVSFTSVDQATPTGTFASATGGGPSLSVTVTSAPTDVVIDTLVTDSNPSSVIKGTGQTQHWNASEGIWAAGSTKPGAATVTMSWTENGSSDDWAMGSVSIRGG
jgi:hypothetical protein